MDRLHGRSAIAPVVVALDSARPVAGQRGTRVVCRRLPVAVQRRREEGVCAPAGPLRTAEQAVALSGQSVTCCNSRSLNYEFCEKALFTVRLIWHNASLKLNHIRLPDVMPTHQK